MITDESQRYALTQVDNTMLWRYDKRMRSMQLHEPFGGKPFQFVEGPNHAMIVAHNDETGALDVSIRSPIVPDRVIASATYDDEWRFDGDSALWSLVPEYLLSPLDDERQGLLRVADGAVVDTLEGFGLVTMVAQVPGSRLVVLVGDGAYTVYDAIAGRSIRRYELAGKNPNPTLRFRNDEEMWLNDIGTMLKIETRQFEVIDAAGSEANADDLAEQDTAEGQFGEFGRWTFASDNQLGVVTRPYLGDVLVLDALSMLPVARCVFRNAMPIDAMLVGRNTVVAVDASGRALRKRVKRVKINFEP